MMSSVVHIDPFNERVECRPGETLLDCIRNAGVRLAGDCGGHGTCRQCRVSLVSGTAEDSHGPIRNDPARYLLACRVRPRGECRVFIPAESIVAAPEVLVSFSISSSGNGAPERPVAHRSEVSHPGSPGGTPLALAVDIGTTTCALYLLESESGRVIDAAGMENPQAPWGSDVVTRLAVAVRVPDHTLQRIIVEGIAAQATLLCRRNGSLPEDIVHALFVGNTAMHHLFLGLPVEQLVNAPYVPAVTGEMIVQSGELNLPFAPGSTTRWLPNIAGYVGGDMVATLLAAGVLHNRDAVLYLDIGTNTEMCLAMPDQLYVLSAPSGPAFEGAHMEHGMRAAPGAIDSVVTGPSAPGGAGYSFTCTTIGGGKPAGMCGSGILDAICSAREQGLVDWRGRLRQGPVEIVPARETAHGKTITLSQRDIRQFQLAQGAIACGVIVLARAAGITPEKIKRVVVAGAFGAHINMNNAVRLGMLPVLDGIPIEQIGNAAGAGACHAAVDSSTNESIQAILKDTRYVELVTAPEFKTTFARATYFSRTRAEREKVSTKGATP